MSHIISLRAATHYSTIGLLPAQVRLQSDWTPSTDDAVLLFPTFCNFDSHFSKNVFLAVLSKHEFPKTAVQYFYNAILAVSLNHAFFKTAVQSHQNLNFGRLHSSFSNLISPKVTLFCRPFLKNWMSWTADFKKPYFFMTSRIANFPKWTAKNQFS